MATFTIAKDADYGWIVLDASVRSRSFAMVPVGTAWSFDAEADARAQARNLSAAGNIETRMIETPDRFEAVADTRYGAAW